jgi:predicted RND superfamily exporter protein
LIHRFYEEKEKEADPIKASKLALKHAFPSITASAFTTIAGFSALFLMDYRIGSDIALVLSKGILFSYLTAVIVLPIFLIWCDKLITKTKHRVFLPSFKKYSIALYKLRFILVPILVIISVLGFIYQQKTEYVYGSGSLADETTTLYTDNQIISERFGSRNWTVILVPNETVAQEVNLVNDLLAYEEINSIQALVTSVDPNIPREFLPAGLVSKFVGESYSRIIINTTIDGENAEMYRLNAEIRETIDLYYDEFYTVGMASSVSDIKDSVLADSAMVVIFSCLAVGFIIMLIFRSISIPVLLVMIIQSSVWLNIALLFAQGIQTQYIGYLVVMSIQLGATIDYAVLLTNRYMDFRKTMNPHDSILEAFQKSSASIIISAVVLSIAGFIEGFFSDILSVTEIGLLLGKGALISGLLIFIFLPPSLVLFDKLIMKTTLHSKDIEKTRT